MMNDLDAALRRLVPETHPGLSAIDGVVMARIRERRTARAAVGAPLIAIAALGAIMLGMSAGALRPAPAAATALSPFASSNALAPSTLLAVDR